MRYKAYRPSGRFTFPGILLLGFGGFLGTFIIEACYVYLLGFLSHLLIRFLVTSLCLLLVSCLLSFLVRVSRTRNRRAIRIVVLTVLILAFYASRCVYVSLVNDMWELGANELLTKGYPFGQLLIRWAKLFISPHVVFSALYKILPYGVTSLNGKMIVGIPLLLIWLIEMILLIMVPYLVTAALSERPYDEMTGLWLTRREEWPVAYIENYREIRTQLKAKNDEPLLSAIRSVSYYKREGQESYAILEFYRGGDYIGPYVTLTNVKAVQSGPRKLRHKYIRLCRLCDIGAQEALQLHEQLEESAKQMGHQKFSIGRFLSDLFSRLGWSQRSKSARHLRLEKEKLSSKALADRTADANQPAAGSKLDAQELKVDRQIELDQEIELDVEIEGETVHVPKVTPEMEKAYLTKKNS